MSLTSMSLSTKTALMVVCSLGLLALAMLGVTATLVQRDAVARAEERQEANMRVAWDVLNDYGDGYSVENGVLRVGDTVLNNNFAPVDRIKGLVGGTATVFMGDMRVTTNVMKPDGNRAVGTPLARGPVYDAVLGRGEPYRGQADILGRPFFVAYDPIKTAGGEVIGVLYVGIPKADFMASVNQLLISLWIAATVVALLIAGAVLWLSRRMFSPLQGLCDRMERLRQGQTDIDAPWAARKDDIGQISRALLAFRDAAAERAQIEAEAQAARSGAESERAATEAERRRLAEEDAVVVAALGKGLAALAAGDLTHRIEVEFAPRSRQLKTDYNAAVTAMGETLREVVERISTMRSGAMEVSGAADDLSRRTERQAASLEETAAALDEITATVRRAAEGARTAADITAAAREGSDARNATLEETRRAMEEIESSSSKIGQIIGVIDEIAFQTNLLALNAGVEAARAGEAGRGFAVVATEVRGLAQRSAEAAREIGALISASTQNVEAGARLVAQTGDTLKGLLSQVAEINTLAAEIAASAQEQATGLAEINTAVNHMDQTTQQNAAMVEQTTAATQALSDEADRLAQLVARFRLDRPGGRVEMTAEAA
jgi:methyl-accepting chemotaxis protein